MRTRYCSTQKMHQWGSIFITSVSISVSVSIYNFWFRNLQEHSNWNRMVEDHWPLAILSPTCHNLHIHIHLRYYPYVYKYTYPYISIYKIHHKYMVRLTYYETMVMTKGKDFHLTIRLTSVSCYKSIDLRQESRLKLTFCPKESLGCLSIMA